MVIGFLDYTNFLVAQVFLWYTKNKIWIPNVYFNARLDVQMRTKGRIN